MTITWEQILAFLCEDQSMAVTSLLFIAFFVAVALVHYLLPRVLRPYFLLAASYGFFCYDPVNRPLVGVVLGATAVSWLCGLIIGKVKVKPVRVLALLVTVLGFCGAAGAALILPALAAEGFFLSFSAGCFAAALGRSGVLLALAAFGVRCLIVLPCSIYPAMLVGERDRWRKLAVCGALLLLGMALELTLVPRLVQWALGALS